MYEFTGTRKALVLSYLFSKYLTPTLLLLLFTSAYPFMFFAIDGHPYKYLIFLILVIFIVCLMLKLTKFRFHDLAVVIMGQIFLYLVLAYYHQDSLYLTVVIQLTGILITFLFIINFTNVEQLSRFIIRLFVVIAICSALVFLLGFTGLIKPYSQLQNPDGSTLYNYIITFSNSVIFHNERQIIRSAGFFDEPGTLGFLIVHVLVLNRISINNRIYEIVLIVCGFSTLSVAFFISICIYLLFCLFSGKPGVLLLATLLLAGACLLIYSATPHELSEDLSRITYQRLLPTESRIIEADGRSELILEGLQINDSNVLFGQGMSATKSTTYNQASIAGPYVQSGIFGLLAMFLPHLYFLIRMLVMNARLLHFALLAILLLNYLQRPFVVSLFTMTLILLIFLAIENSNFSRKSAIRHTFGFPQRFSGQ